MNFPFKLIKIIMVVIISNLNVHYYHHWCSSQVFVAVNIIPKKYVGVYVGIYTNFIRIPCGIQSFPEFMLVCLLCTFFFLFFPFELLH